MLNIDNDSHLSHPGYDRLPEGDGVKLDVTADCELDTDPEVAEFMRVAELVQAWNQHRTAGTTDSPECWELDAQLEQVCDRWDMDRNGYLYLL